MILLVLFASLTSVNASAVTAQSFSFGGQKFSFGGSNRNSPARTFTQGNGRAFSFGGSNLQQTLQSAANGQINKAIGSVVSGEPPKSIGNWVAPAEVKKSIGSWVAPGNNATIKIGNVALKHAAAWATGVGVGVGVGGGGYKNPFCGPRYDYSCPIQCTPGRTFVSHDGEYYFRRAREEFKARNYGNALSHVDQAIEKLPNVPDLYQFRSLVLFALGDYQESAAAAYAALSAGPGWNWETLYGFYGDSDTYTKHLRGLETETKAQPDSVDAHFLLGYHYLMLNEVEAGRRQLEMVLELSPGEPLTTNLVAMLPASDSPAPPSVAQSD
jgi:hypothetical protein